MWQEDNDNVTVQNGIRNNLFKVEWQIRVRLFPLVRAPVAKQLCGGD